MDGIHKCSQPQLFSSSSKRHHLSHSTMQSQILFVALAIAGSLVLVQSAAVRVRIANNPYLYEIGRPVAYNAAGSLPSESNIVARATPVHPVRGFQALPTETRSRFQAAPATPVASRAALRQPVEEAADEIFPPKPYKIEYESVDGNGTQMRREETKDDKGVVRGSYSYTDPFGVFRVVEYIADENGYRASIRTNEPGVAKNDNGDPASVIYEIDPTPNTVAAAGAAGSSRSAGAARRA